MSDTLQEPVSVLCEEVGLPPARPDAQGMYHLLIDGQELRLSTLADGRSVLLGVVGRADALAAQRDESREALLTGCLALQTARFARLASEQVLSLEPETDELILWQSFPPYALSIPTLLAAAEALLNELEFWKNWLSPR